MNGNRSMFTLLQSFIDEPNGRDRILQDFSDELHRSLVSENLDDRPLRVKQDQFDHAVALLQGLCRGVERNLIAGPVLERILNAFVQNALAGDRQRAAKAALGFEPPWFLLISPTGRCNLRCKGCYAASDPGSHGSLDYKTFDRILTEKEELWGSYFTVISGGEPFLWRDGQRDLLDVVAGHPSTMFLSFTNATLITEDVARRLSDLGNLTPAVSVEGFERETDDRRGKGVHRRILLAFENLRKYGVPFGVSATPTRANWEVITSDRFVDFYFEEQGALYGWLFQYMPIGRSPSIDLMVPPEDRVQMLLRMRRIVRERKVLLADFWNSGTASNGCVSAGRPGGYYYIDWNGDITPCAFIPYAADNIHRIYRDDGTISSVLGHPFLRRIRDWQDRYGYAQPAERTGNWLCPCVIRDHFPVLRDAVCRCGARPTTEEASSAIRDKGYCEAMEGYGREIRRLTDPLWEAEYGIRRRRERVTGEVEIHPPVG